MATFFGRAGCNRVYIQRFGFCGRLCIGGRETVARNECGVTIFAYANNHYPACPEAISSPVARQSEGGSPDTVKLFREYRDKKK
jgi:hypothetical protein